MPDEIIVKHVIDIQGVENIEQATVAAKKYNTEQEKTTKSMRESGSEIFELIGKVSLASNIMRGITGGFAETFLGLRKVTVGVGTWSRKMDAVYQRTYGLGLVTQGIHRTLQMVLQAEKSISAWLEKRAMAQLRSEASVERELLARREMLMTMATTPMMIPSGIRAGAAYERAGLRPTGPGPHFPRTTPIFAAGMRSEDMSKWTKETTKANKALGSFSKGALAGAASIGIMIAAMVGIGIVFKTISMSIHFFTESISEAIEEEKRFIALSHAVEGTGTSWESVKNRVTDYLFVLQETTSYSDTRATDAIQKLLTYNMQLGEAQRILVAAMDLSRAKNLDLMRSIQVLGKAYEGKYTALMRLGFHFERTGNIVTNFDNILKEVNKRFGGAEKAYLDSYAGSIEQLSVAWEETHEQVGAMIISNPILLKSLQLLTSELHSFNRELKDIAPFAEKAWGVFEKLPLFLVIQGFFKAKNAIRDFIGTTSELSTTEEDIKYPTEAVKRLQREVEKLNWTATHNIEVWNDALEGYKKGIYNLSGLSKHYKLLVTDLGELQFVARWGAEEVENLSMRLDWLSKFRIPPIIPPIQAMDLLEEFDEYSQELRWRSENNVQYLIQDQSRYLSWYKDHLVDKIDLEKMSEEEITAIYKRINVLDEEMAMDKYDRDHEFLEGHLRILDELIAGEIMYSDKWMSLQQRRNEILGILLSTQIEFASIARSGLESLVSGMIDAIGTGERLEDIFSDIVQQLSKMVIKMIVFKSLASALGGPFGGFTPWHQGGMVMHEGGIIPGFQRGGLIGDDRIIRAQTGEMVINRAGVNAAKPDLDFLNEHGKMPGGNITLIINNNQPINFADDKSVKRATRDVIKPALEEVIARRY